VSEHNPSKLPPGTEWVEPQPWPAQPADGGNQNAGDAGDGQRRARIFEGRAELRRERA
jgi:hypothetical protein